jgi:NAD-dependent dihydropyrimidine dehydrogenase PreA subunit
MAKDLSNQTWHGIPRKDIPWYPTIIVEKCIGCELCYVSCGREVFEYDESTRKAIVERPYNCMVGCSTCATICPTEAITFPGRDLIWKIEKEYKIFKEVRKEGKEKREKSKILADRAKIEAQLSKITSKIKFEITGQFGEKQFLLKLMNFISDKPIDIVNLKLDVPTVKGHMEKAPAFMSFEVTSTEQEDIMKYIDDLKQLIKENEMIIVSENKV